MQNERRTEIMGSAGRGARGARWFASLLCLALIAAACGDSDSGGDTAEVESATTAAAAPATTDGPVAAPTTSEPSTTEGGAPVEEDGGEEQRNEQGWWPLLRKSRQADMDHLTGDIEAEFGTVAPLWLEPGTRYSTSQLGSTISFEVPEAIALVEENPAMVVLRFNTNSGQAAMLMTRPRGAFMGDAAADPEAPIARLAAAEPMPEDVAEFLADRTAVVVDSATELELAGTPATRYEVRVEPGEGPAYPCQVGPSCVNTLLPGPSIGVGIVLAPDRSSVVYEIEQDGTDIVIFVNADAGQDDQLEVADEVIQSIVVEEEAPLRGDELVWQLSTAVLPGQYRFAGVPDLAFDLDQPLEVYNASGVVDFTDAQGRTLAVARIVADGDGKPVADVDAFVGLLQEGIDPDALGELGAATVLEQEARVFELGSLGPSQVGSLFHHAIPDDGEPWETTLFPYYERNDESAAARAWVFERNGEPWVVLVNTPIEGGIDDAVAWAQSILSRVTVL